ncbi:hypothetical protein C8R47DRAFT_1146815 [Mycena vitilis]|nr:hypothetical protein C8R47DRAFT_1146815 [Mycena vitilis]
MVTDDWKRLAGRAGVRAPPPNRSPAGSPQARTGSAAGKTKAVRTTRLAKPKKSATSPASPSPYEPNSHGDETSAACSEAGGRCTGMSGMSSRAQRKPSRRAARLGSEVDTSRCPHAPSTQKQNRSTPRRLGRRTPRRKHPTSRRVRGHWNSGDTTFGPSSGRDCWDRCRRYRITRTHIACSPVQAASPPPQPLDAPRVRITKVQWRYHGGGGALRSRRGSKWRQEHVA